MTVCLPVNFSKARYVCFKHLCKDLYIEIFLNTLLGAEILQDSSDVRQKNIVQRAALNYKKDVK